MLKLLRYGLWALLAALSITIAGKLLDPAPSKNISGTATETNPIGAPFTLIDHLGTPITQHAMKGTPAAVFFGFTHCPEICPTTLYELTNWIDMLGDEGKDLNVFFISVDPVRDTPQRMKKYLSRFSNRITGITGDPNEINKLTKAWYVYTNRVSLGDGEYTMDHTASIFLLRVDGSLHGTIDYKDTTNVALQKLRSLLSL